MLRTLAIAALALSQLAFQADPYADQRPIAWNDLLDRPRESADHRIAFGEGEQEFGELWLPEGDGPFPVIAMIHGGCWLSQIPGTILQDYLAADLRARGIAVWNLEYARIGHETGGWPGTFQDIATGIDHLRVIAPQFNLDLDDLVFTGHSAGGHLALWAAGRASLPEDSLVYAADPLLPRRVVTLAGINDLADYRENGPGRCGEPETVDNLIGPLETHSAELMAQVSPGDMPAIPVQQVLVSGALDPIVPPRLGTHYQVRAQLRGERVTHVTIEGAGHFELIDPTAPAWTLILDALSAD
jgi:acetyl esterase/lipase